MVYKAEVTINTTYKEYYGTSEGEFKSRCNNTNLLLSKYNSFSILNNKFCRKLFTKRIDSFWSGGISSIRDISTF